MNWEEIKKKGSTHYKTGNIEPIDLFRSGGILWDWCIGEIIAKACRIHYNVSVDGPTIHDLAPLITKDLDKIIHYAEMLKACIEEGAENAKETTEQLRSLSSKGHRVGSKPNRRRP